ncbi:MAG TPA: zf-HC2 domain-containing protein [Thermoanaerobaculia bacterium]|nr:zf-HC2 domain-containing protein [Thermoanaerobaculia bacterium]
MNCDLAAALLPWLLNGTLEAGERRELIAHLRGCGACRAALADTQLAWDIFDWHPSAAALVAHAGAVEAGGSAAPVTTGDAGAGAIEEHLAGCPKCAAELELLRTSRLLADPAEDGRIAILPAPREEAAKRQGLPAPAAASAAVATTAPPAAATASVAAAPAPAATWGRRDDAAARRAWQRAALAASVVGLLAATGWIESARHSRELERRLASAPAVAPVRTGAASPSAVVARTRPPASPGQAPSGPGEAELRRRAGEAEARLRALADENRQLQQQVAALGSTATELSRRSDALQASQPAPGPRIESDLLVTDVEPAERAERGTGAPAAAAIPLSSGAATLLLHTRHRDSYPDYEIEVRDAQGRLVGKPTRVFRAPGGQDSFEEFDITLGRGALAPGTYTLHLFGRPPGGAAKGGREALETYSIRVS